jgi:histidinol-phosphate aminotransferase
VPLKEDKCYDLDGLLAAITDKTKMIVICNPNNPTGQYLGEDEILAFVEKVPKNIVLLFDEAYLEFATAPDCKSMLPLMLREMGERPILILKTFSKYYGMAGIRVGYTIASEELIAGMNKCGGGSVNRPGMYAAIQALKEQEYYQEMKAKIVAGREYIQEELTKMNVKVYPSQTNFILFDCKRDYTAVRQMLIDKGILINNPMLNRVSVSNEEDNVYFIQCMKEILETLPEIES